MAVHASNVAVGVGLHLFQMMELSIMFVISVKENWKYINNVIPLKKRRKVLVLFWHFVRLVCILVPPKLPRRPMLITILCFFIVGLCVIFQSMLPPDDTSAIAMYITEHIKHTCCWLLHVNVDCLIPCNFDGIIWVSSAIISEPFFFLLHYDTNWSM